jgi:hypothetical protein
MIATASSEWDLELLQGGHSGAAEGRTRLPWSPGSRGSIPVASKYRSAGDHSLHSCQASATAQRSPRSVGRVHDLEVGLAEASPDEMCPNRLVRSRPTSPQREFFKPAPLRAPSNTLIYLAFNIRTKTAVVRLRRRKWAERHGNGPKVAPRAGRRGSDNSPGMAAFCGLSGPMNAVKKNVPTGCLGGGGGIRTPDTAYHRITV